MTLLARVLDPATHARLNGDQQSVLLSHIAKELNADESFARAAKAQEDRMQEIAQAIVKKMGV